ncbi:glycosyltransferase family 39 protein, partial [Flavihumibacter cheonanensis]|nr:glycosyltransferase family 39 protein [Flavihumibacter cheonanensis]
INALKVGIVAALLMYSKYHGAFLILVSLIPNYRLLWNRYFYLAALVGIGLYSPHLYWQYQHDFVSFRYHLVQRADGFMGGKHVLNYLLNVFLILN